MSQKKIYTVQMFIEVTGVESESKEDAVELVQSEIRSVLDIGPNLTRFYREKAEAEGEEDAD